MHGSKRREQIRYKMGDVSFKMEDGIILNTVEDEMLEEQKEHFIKTYEQLIEDATIVPQYDPKEKYKLENEDVEGFIVHGVHSSKLCVSLIRKGYSPTSDYFNYGDLDRL